MCLFKLHQGLLTRVVKVYSVVNIDTKLKEHGVHHGQAELLVVNDHDPIGSVAIELEQQTLILVEVILLIFENLGRVVSL